MSKLLTSKKGVPSTQHLLIGAILLFLCIIVNASGMIQPSRSDTEFEALTKVGVPIIFMGIGFLMMLIGNKFKKTYINVYTDHVEGAGMAGNSSANLQNFYFDKNSHYNIQKEGSKIRVTCNGATYYVNLTEPDAQAVFNCANRGY